MLDQEARTLLDLMDKAVAEGRPKLHTLPYKVGRAAVDKMSEDSEAAPPDVAAVGDGGFAGAGGGDSAGGAIATVVCQDVRQLGEPMPAFQMLIYPATDSSKQSASRIAFAEGYFLTKELIDWFWKAYVPAGTDLADLKLSPLLAKNFTGLPPAFVLTAGYDPLRDEGRAYAERLI